MEIGKIGVFCSGGDSPGMNAAIRAVVRSAIRSGKEVVAIERGYQGMINNSFVPMTSRSVANILYQGGTFLKSARCEEFRTPEGRTKAAQNLQNHGVNALVCIGGNGSYAGAQKLAEEHGIACIGIPGTIDNDLYATQLSH